MYDGYIYAHRVWRFGKLPSHAGKVPVSCTLLLRPISVMFLRLASVSGMVPLSWLSKSCLSRCRPGVQNDHDGVVAGNEPRAVSRGHPDAEGPPPNSEGGYAQLPQLVEAAQFRRDASVEMVKAKPQPL